MDRGKKAKATILISDKIDIKAKAIKRDTEGHFIILQGGIHEAHTDILNINVPNIGATKYIRKIIEDLKKDIDSNRIVVGDFNNVLWSMDRSSTQIICKDVVELNDTLDQMD